MRTHLLLLIALVGCNGTDDGGTPEPEVLRPVEVGSPMAGAAESFLELPVGTPLSGYSARCACLSGISRPDSRDSAYTTAFVESAGVQVRPTVKAVWIDNGNEQLVLIKEDLIYSWDGLTEAISRRLSEETGIDLSGNVVHLTNHNHSSYGTFSDDVAFYLGSDRFNQENFDRMVEQAVAVALQAYENRQPAAIGVGWDKDWDPDGHVYHDRRPENDALAVWDDVPPGMGKDPYLTMLRIDDLQGNPIAVTFGFGFHPYVTSERSALVSGDATVVLERHIAEEFDHPVVVMHFQTGGGDASVAGTDHDWARMETIGEWGKGPILDLWNRTPTSSDPIRLETHSQHVSLQHDDIHVTREGTVDWRYSPYEEDYVPDDIIFDENGDLISPIDEFNTPNGAVFCGTGDLDFPIGGLESNVYPYDVCLQVDLLSRLIKGIFYLEEEDVALPLVNTISAGTAAARIGPLPTLFPDGTEDTEDLFVGFFPGEPTAMYTEQWRRKVRDTLGLRMGLMVGYSMDHEGYLLIPEDWLAGGYEADIVIWGPLAAEHIMERVLEYASDVLWTDVHEHRPADSPQPAVPVRPTTIIEPDLTADAGTIVTEAPDRFWLPEPFLFDPVQKTEVPRVQGMVQLTWKGGDPAVDNPAVTLERLGEDGETWAPVVTPAGHVINEDLMDILLAYTPLPLYPAEAVQDHYWWFVWQAVGHVHDRMNLPLGTYRLHVEGHRYTGGATAAPWPSEPYEVMTDPFEIVPAPISLAWDGTTLSGWIQGPADGFRLLDMQGDSTGENPLHGDLSVTFWREEGDDLQTVEATLSGRRAVIPATVPDDATHVVVTDAWGNTGEIDL